ncbi:MAG: 50S ribosomal protein L24 [Candidatus Omnitrophota bacterium]|nr:50S ribosomal protein L24 [Candidatus Omnitrophota bacterium]
MGRITHNNIVKVLAGKDRGKQGKVLRVFPKKKRLLVEGINFIKKHTRQTKQDTKGGIIQKESPIHVSNLMLICKKCNKPTRIGMKIMNDGSVVKVCKKCKETIV